MFKRKSKPKTKPTTSNSDPDTVQVEVEQSDKKIEELLRQVANLEAKLVESQRQTEVWRSKA